MITDDEEILICAVRYALGRMSYMVDDVARYVGNKRKTLSKQCIDIIIRDIEEAVRSYHDLGLTLGMECDERTWIRLMNVLKGEREDNDRKKTTHKG